MNMKLVRVTKRWNDSHFLHPFITFCFLLKETPRISHHHLRKVSVSESNVLLNEEVLTDPKIQALLLTVLVISFFLRINKELFFFFQFLIHRPVCIYNLNICYFFCHFLFLWRIVTSCPPTPPFSFKHLFILWILTHLYYWMIFQATQVKNTSDEFEQRVLYEFLAEASVVFPKVFPVV